MSSEMKGVKKPPGVNIKTQKLFELSIESMSHGAYGVARQEDGQIVFVENVCLGDEIVAEIYDQRKNFAFANLTTLVKASEHRDNNPKCKIHKICGGCQWQHIQYEKQLEFKINNLKSLFKNANIEIKNEILPVIGMENPWNYRNKIIYPVDTVKGSGRLLAGYYKRNTHKLINVKCCPIQYSAFDEIMTYAKDLCSKHHIGKPLLRHIALRSNMDQTEMLLTFIVNPNETDSKGDSSYYKKNIKKIFENLSDRFSRIKGCTLNYNGLSTNVIFGEQTETIIGQENITDTLKFSSILNNGENVEARFKISATSFFQINNTQFVTIIKTIEGFISDELQAATLHKLRVLDAYAGVGAISISLAKILSHNFDVTSSNCRPDLMFTAVESVASAVRDGIENSRLNNVAEIVNFKLGKVEEHIGGFASGDFDFVIINPPRKGCTNKVLDALGKISSPNIIYVSCNPSTLVRDLKYLERFGYSLERFQAVDMFPHTFHVESIALIKL